MAAAQRNANNNEQSWWVTNVVIPWANNTGIDQHSNTPNFFTDAEKDIIFFLGVGGGTGPGRLSIGSGVSVRAASRIAPSFSKTELAIIAEERTILSSEKFALIRSAHDVGRSITIKVGGRTIQYEPGLPASGMTMFGENGFLIGREAFRNAGELNKTVLHELYRLNTSSSLTTGVSGASAAAETSAAFNFAERAAGGL